jgi:creatinine amidohydrolase
MAPGRWIEDMAWPEVAGRLAARAVVLVPVGAAAKEHGHHLPMKTDYLLARALAEGVAAALPLLVAPIVSLGHYPAFVDYPGSQHLRAETFIALLKDVLGKLIADGATRIAVLNTGVSTSAPIEIATRDLYGETGIRIATADIERLGLAVRRDGAQLLGGHGDEWETSLILAIAPETVRLDRAIVDYGNVPELPKTVFRQPVRFRDDPASGIDHSRTGVRGDPTLATAEKGRRLLDAMVEELVLGLRALFPDPPA